MIKTKILIFAGLPGSGKGFHSQWLVQKYGFSYISAGDLCRANLDYFDPVKKQTIAQIVESGAMISSQLVSQLIVKEITQHVQTTNTVIILDGFPRNLDQHQIWTALLAKNNWEVRFFFLTGSPAKAAQRVSNRLICSQCGLVYNRTLNRPRQVGLCNRDQAKLVQRSDDLRFAKRMETFCHETQPMIDLITQTQPTAYHEFNVDTLSLEKIRKQMINVFQKQRWV